MVLPGEAPDDVGDDDADDDADGGGAAPSATGMQRITPEEALAAEKLAAEKLAALSGPNAPAMNDEKLKQLKAKARAEIADRLSDRRKKRKLLRGNSSDVHESLS